MNKEIKRGYVKWTDDEGVFHKEPLADHPELLKDANPNQQLAAEEVKRLNAAAEEFFDKREDENANLTADAVEALKAAPKDVLTAGQLTTADDGEGNTIIVESSAVAPAETKNDAPASAPEEPVSSEPVKPADDRTDDTH